MMAVLPPKLCGCLSVCLCVCVCVCVCACECVYHHLEISIQQWSRQITVIALEELLEHLHRKHHPGDLVELSDLPATCADERIERVHRIALQCAPILESSW